MTHENKSEQPTRPRWFRRLREKAGLDRAVVLTLLTRAWQAIAGAISLLLIAKFFEPETQGFYYTFSSLLGLQIFVELALSIVIVNRASHEWSRLRLDASGSVVGDAAALSRLASLVRFIVKWYSGVSLLFVVGVGLAGHLFFSGSPSTELAWQAPWWTLVIVAAIQLWLMPLLSLVEGCNQVIELNRFRLAQTIAEALVMWLLLAAGTGLWVPVGALAIRLCAGLFFLAGKYGRFFRSLHTAARQEEIRWSQEIWPMQWRIAMQGVVAYFLFSIITPIMFHYHGSTIAGQTGMTLQIVGAVQAVAFAWIQTKVPQFGMLVAQRKYSELDKLWQRASRLSFGFGLAGSLFVWGAVFLLNELGVAFASRVLGPLPTALFLGAQALMQVSGFFAVYLRAHAREPFVVMGVSSSVLIGALVFVFGGRYGPTGAAVAFLAVAGLYVVPMSIAIWSRRRAEWQRA